MKVQEVKPVAVSLILYYSNLICEKIDLHVEAFLKRIKALEKGDREKAEFIEEMALKPLEEQQKFLAKKLCSLTEGWK